MTTTAYLVILNWTPWNLYLQLNGAPVNPLKPSAAKYSYFPFLQKYPRDLTLDYGTRTAWGKSNRLVVNFEEVSEQLEYPQLDDPGAITSADMYLWVFPSFVVFSQQSSLLKEVMPD